MRCLTTNECKYLMYLPVCTDQSNRNRAIICVFQTHGTDVSSSEFVRSGASSKSTVHEDVTNLICLYI